MKNIFNVFAAKRPAPLPAPPAPAQQAMGPVTHQRGGPSPTYSKEAAIEAGEFVNTIPRTPSPRTIFIPPSVSRHLVEKSGKPIVTEDELNQVRNLHIEYTRTVDFLMKHLGDGADAAWVAQQKQLESEVRTGHGEQASGRDSWTREDFREDFEQKRKALSSTCRDISAKCGPIAFAVAARIGGLAKAEADTLEKAERETARVWGLDFVPSRLLLSLRYIEDHHGELVPPIGANAPKVMLRFAGIEI